MAILYTKIKIIKVENKFNIKIAHIGNDLLNHKGKIYKG